MKLPAGEWAALPGMHLKREAWEHAGSSGRNLDGGIDLPLYYGATLLLLRPGRWRCTRRSGGFESVGPDTWETERKKLTHPQEKGDKKARRGGEELMG